VVYFSVFLRNCQEIKKQKPLWCGGLSRYTLPLPVIFILRGGNPGRGRWLRHSDGEHAQHRPGGGAVGLKPKKLEKMEKPEGAVCPLRPALF
jgi:hypothetical protein